MTDIERRIKSLERKSGELINRQKYEQRLAEVQRFLFDDSLPEEDLPPLELIVQDPEGNHLQVNIEQYDLQFREKGWSFVRFV